MRITHLLTNEIIIARLATVSGDKMAFSTVTAEMSNIQSGARNATEISDGNFSKPFRIYLDACSVVKAGDRLRDEDNNYYTVVSDGVTTFSMGSIDYKVAIVQKTKL